MRRALAAVALAGVGMTGACSSDGIVQTTPSPTPTPPAPTHTPASTSPTPTPTPTPVAEVSITCDDQAAGSDFTAAWRFKYKSCDADVLEITLPVQRKALEVAYAAEDRDESALGVLYGMCAQNDIGGWSYMSDGGTDGQWAEVRGMLTLCPTHPLRKQLTAYIAKGQAEENLRAQGRVFGEGTLRVGEDVKPGTYEATNVSDCYWERQDRNGGTIANDFVLGAKRVQVTIRSTDYGFTSEGCGEWRPAR